MAKIQFFVLLVFIVQLISANDDNDNWPCYLKKCKRTDPNFNRCLFYHANYGLKHLFKGDEDTGIPKFVPLSLDPFTIGKNQTFKIVVSDAQLFGINYMDVTNITWDLDKKNIWMKFKVSNTIRITGNFIANGSFYGKDVTGTNGIMDLVHGGGTVDYNMTYTTRLLNGMNYGSIDQCKGTRKSAFARYRFHQNNANGNVTDELSVSSAEQLDEDLQPDFTELICFFINLAMRPLFYNFPIDMMFD